MEAPSRDVKNVLLATSKYEKQIQEDSDPYITRDRLNDGNFRRKLDPIAKDVIRKENPIELVFKHISTFDAINPIVGSLLKEIHIGKKDIFSKIISKALSIVDLDIKSRPKQLRYNNNNLGDNNNINNNNNNNPHGLEVLGGIWHGISRPLAARLKCTYHFNENKKQIIPPRPSRGPTRDVSPREKPAWDRKMCYWNKLF